MCADDDKVRLDVEDAVRSHADDEVRLHANDHNEVRLVQIRK